MTITTSKTVNEGSKIGWGNNSLTQMLEESEQLFRESGKYYGIEELELKQKDIIRYERMFARLRGSLVGARETAINISASPIVKEIGELCFALYTPEGDSVALSTGIIVHVHTMSDAIKHMIRTGYEDNPKIQPGDIFGNNDPLIGDVHNADVQTLVPIFYEGELIGWAGGVTHEIDIGSVNPGSLPTGHTTRYEDGILISCEKIGDNDQLYRSYEWRCQHTVRLPMYWMLDERTRLAGCHMIRDALLDLIKAEGIDTYKKFVREVIEEGRRSFISRVKELTIPGKYAAPAFYDVPFARYGQRLPSKAAKDTMMHAPLEITIGNNGQFSLSFEGANKWGWHNFNCSPSAMQGALWVLLSQTVIPNDKINDGAYFATNTIVPPGSWCNPSNTIASTTFSWAFLMPAFTGVFRSLSRAFQARGYVEEVVSGFPSTGNIFSGGGVDHYGNESAFTNFDMACCGTGAGMIRDGENSCAAMWNPEGDCGDVESWEVLEPFLYLGRRLKPNSGGAGKFRGGHGFESLRMVWRTNNQVVYNLGEGHVFVGGGIFGGYPLASGYRHSVNNTNVKELVEGRLPYPTYDGDPQESLIDELVTGEVTFDSNALGLAEPFKEYDLYLSLLRGGSGVGDPLERSIDLIEEDLNEELLLPRFAEKVYGAVVYRDSNKNWHVDLQKTEQRRTDIRKERIQNAIPVDKWIGRERDKILNKELSETVMDTYKSSIDLSPSWKQYFYEFWCLPGEFGF